MLGTSRPPHYDGPVTSGATTWLAHRRASNNWRPLVSIVGAVVLANCAFIIFGYESSPLWWTSAISARVCAWTCSLPSVDPNVGFITQPLGHQAALDLLHGHLPWWNYFEGMGQPLAGEMQSAALLPLVVLFIFPAGLLLFHLSLEIIAGASTYFLVRKLGVGPTIATLAGVLFALNGTFSWIGNAVVNPIAFLPMMVLGIEIAVEHSREARRAGWVIMALAFALSIYAGFPEMAYLDGLIAAEEKKERVVELKRGNRVLNVLIKEGALTPRQALIYGLCYEKRLCESEVASLLGIVPRTVQRLRQKARASLARGLAKYRRGALFLKKAVSHKLTRKQKRIFRLRYREGLSVKEIAAKFGRTERSVQRVLLRTLKKIFSV